MKHTSVCSIIMSNNNNDKAELRKSYLRESLNYLEFTCREDEENFKPLFVYENIRRSIV